MPEELRENLILILVVFVPIFAYLIISRLLSRSFKKTPDNPLFPEKSTGNVIIRIIKRAPITLIVVVLAFVIASHNREWIAKGFDDHEARRETIMKSWTKTMSIRKAEKRSLHRPIFGETISFMSQVSNPVPILLQQFTRWYSYQQFS